MLFKLRTKVMRDETDFTNDEELSHITGKQFKSRYQILGLSQFIGLYALVIGGTAGLGAKIVGGGVPLVTKFSNIITGGSLMRISIVAYDSCQNDLKTSILPIADSEIMSEILKLNDVVDRPFPWISERARRSKYFNKFSKKLIHVITLIPYYKYYWMILFKSF